MTVAVAEQSIALRAEAEQVARLYNQHVSPGAPAILRDVDTVQLLLASLSDGNYRETACRAAGIAKGTLYNTIKRAEAGDVAAMAFVDAVEKAEAAAESSIVRDVRVAAKSPQFWAAGMTLLERKSPDRWGRRQDDQNTPKVVVQIGASSSDVTVNVMTSHSQAPNIIETPTEAIDVTPVDATSKYDVSKVTERCLSDADTGRSKVVQTQSVDETREAATPGVRRGTSRGTQPGRRGLSKRAGASQPKGSK